MRFKSAYEDIKYYINFYFFTQGNFFTGSLGDNFCYRIFPDQEHDVFNVSRYSGACFEKAEDKVSENFEFSEEGLDAAAKWIASEYGKYMENNKCD